MSETDISTAPAMNAWLMKDSSLAASGSPEYVVRIETLAGAHSAIAAGDWVLVTDDEGRIERVGQIYRVRHDLDNSTVFFDRQQMINGSILLGDLGLTSLKGPVARLPWEDFLRALPNLGIADLDQVPLIQDEVYVRNLLEQAVRDDLLGPACGPNELIKDMSVRDRYLVGKLAPRRPDESVTDRVEPASGADEHGDLEDQREAPLHEPGAEFASATGRVEPEDDALDEIDTTNNQSLVPSSMGFTFCVAPDVDALTVEARWGRYERVPNDEHDIVKRRTNRHTGREEETKVRVWQRIPCGGSFPLSLKDGRIPPIAPDPDQPDVRIQGTVRTNEKGERLVSLFLVNGQIEPDTNKDGAWLFQPEIVAMAPEELDDRSVFRRRPDNEVVVDDPERDRLATIYRNRLEFAVGHGVSILADTAPKDQTKAILVRTEIIPRHEVEITETPGQDANDRPASREMIDNGWLDMTRLAEMGQKDLREALSCLIDDYGTWISDQRKRLGKEIIGFDKAGNDAMARCEETFHRLREGMEVLFKDEKALAAFRFANRSMALQRIRSIYALKRRRNEEVDIASLDIRNEDVFKFLLKHKGEFLLNFMSDHINRHAEYEKVSAAYGRFLADPEWENEFAQLPDDWNNEKRILHLLKAKMKEAKVAKYLPDFPILMPAEERLKMRLILGTHSAKGLEVFRDVQAKVERDEIAIRNSIRDNNSNQKGLFSDDYIAEFQQEREGVGCAKYLDQAKDEILEALRSCGASKFAELSSRVMDKFPIRLTQTKSLLCDMKKEGLVNFTLPPRKRVPQDDTRSLRSLRHRI